MDKNSIGLSILVALCLLSNSLQAQLGERIRINGYSSFEFEKQFGNNGKGDPNASFDADLFDLVLNIYATDRLRIAADITWEHGTASEDDRGNAAIEYAFPEYTVYNWLKIRAGKMFVPFGIYNEIHTAKPAFLTVKEPLSTNKPHKFGTSERFYPRWATGIAFVGNFMVIGKDFDYNLQISNGEQESTNPFEEDDNKQKAIAGRLRLTPVQGLKIGFSFYKDSETELDQNDEDTGERTNDFSYGGQLEWRMQNFGLEVEYVGHRHKQSNGTLQRAYAFTLMGFYTLHDRFTPYLRFEYLDPNTRLDNDTAKMFVYGINTEVDENLYLKAELNTVDPSSSNSRFSGVGFTEFKFAIAVGF